MEYLSFNGVLQSKNQFTISPQNRAFRYGDSVFETLFATQGVVPYFDLHFSRLMRAMQVLRFDNTEKFQTNKNKIYGDILRLLKRNRLYKGARIRMTVYRKDGGLYTPLDNEFDYLIEVEKLAAPFFQINSKGLKLNLYADAIEKGRFSFFKSGNSLHYVLASLSARDNGIDECLLVNKQKQIVESTSSNVFIVNNGVLFTPGLQSGCVDGVMRRTIIQIAQQNKIPVYDDVVLEEIDFLSADEILLSNAVSGIRWAVAFKHKRYFNKMGVFLLEKINLDIQQKINDAQ